MNKLSECFLVPPRFHVFGQEPEPAAPAAAPRAAWGAEAYDRLHRVASRHALPRSAMPLHATLRA